MLFSVYVMLGQPYEFVGLMDHLQDRGLLDTGEYFVVGVHLGQYDPLNPQYYFQGKLYAMRLKPLSNSYHRMVQMYEEDKKRYDTVTVVWYGVEHFNGHKDFLL